MLLINVKQFAKYLRTWYPIWNGRTSMEWQIWITWWIIFFIRYSRLFWLYLKKHREKIDNPSIIINVNKIENRITFKIKTGYYLKLFKPGTMKLFGSTENEITKDKDGENVPHLEITELLLVYCNVVNNDY